MELERLNTSIVILAKHHNPTILHPSFLASEGIVPSNWETVESVCTPVFAIVKYKNGIVFNVQENKLQVTDNKIEGDFKNSQIADFARKYALKLPHVHYNAVGINFNGIISCSNAESILIGQFLNPSSADFNSISPEALGLRVVYNVPDARLRLSIDAGRVNSGSESERSGILLNANYHMDLPEDSRERRIKDIERIVSLFNQHSDNFITVTDGILLRRLNK